MAEFTFDLKIACQVAVTSGNASHAEALLPDVVDSINALLSGRSEVHKALTHVYLEIDDCDGPVLLDEDEDNS